jgi:cellulose synthase/poly-beta-1,6-N-acetylglucosamine synthase-like glycosyltransferase
MLVFWILVFALAVQLFYYLFFFLRLARYRGKQAAEQLPPVSVVICARNEDDNLVAFLPLVLAQDYPDFQVVVVNDCSFDNTEDILKEFAERHPHLKVVTIKEDEYYSHGKKVALMMGIKGAKHEHLLLTDADCRPAGTNWLRNMAGHFTTETEIVLGYGPYEKRRGLLNKLIRFDAFFIALQYLSFSLARVTYMGVGRNLAYKKELFYRHKGFASHYHIRSGDDDLFVNEAATRTNTRVELNPDSFTHSVPEHTFIAWWRQKRRHLSTGKRYKFGHKFLLINYVLSQWLFFGSFIAALVLNFQPYVVIGILMLRMLLQILIFKKTMEKLGERDLLFLAPFVEIFLLFFYPALTFAGIFQRRRKWMM